MFLAEGLPGSSSGAERSYDRFPDESEFPELIAGYAAWDGRVKQ